MHEKRSKIDFFVNFRKLQKKLPICKKKYAKILNSVRAVVTDVEKKVKPRNRIFLLVKTICSETFLKIKGYNLSVI